MVVVPMGLMQLLPATDLYPQWGSVPQISVAGPTPDCLIPGFLAFLGAPQARHGSVSHRSDPAHGLYFDTPNPWD